MIEKGSKRHALTAQRRVVTQSRSRDDEGQIVHASQRGGGDDESATACSMTPCACKGSLCSCSL
jgi:hypothetical protein